MKVARFVLLVVSVGILTMSCKKEDLLGTWEGVANIPEDPPRIDFVLKITEENGALKGTISDNMGFVEDAPLQDLKIDKNSFSCHIVTTDYMAYRVNLTGTYNAKDKTLSGELEVPAEGVVGTWKCTKKPEQASTK